MKALRQAACVVVPLHEVGNGVPDLLVGRCGRNFLLEVKDPEQPASNRKLTPDQKDWHEIWPGQVTVVYTPEDALKAVGVIG